MADPQLISLVITLVTVFIGVLLNKVSFGCFSNGINGLKDAPREEAATSKAEIVAEISAMRRAIDAIRDGLARIPKEG